MSKHTPGPWIFIEGGPLEGDTVITTQDRMNGDIIPIVDMDTDYEGEIGIEQEANAKLIAAAPELLAVCQGVLSHPSFKACDCGEPDCATTVLRAVIAKATT
jgi:hypothetical protein